MKTPTDLALAALNGFKWLGNNLHNIKDMPDQFESFYKAALDDAEKAIAALSPPDPIAQGHNPDRLTVSQVGDGWRLLDEDEALWYIQNNKQASQTEFWDKFGKHWHHFEDDRTPVSRNETQRTRLTHEELMALDKPSAPVMVPWTFEDAPMVFRVKDKADGSLYRAEIYPEHVGIFHSYAPQAFRAISYQYLLDNFVQLDGSPCGIVK